MRASEKQGHGRRDRHAHRSHAPLTLYAREQVDRIDSSVNALLHQDAISPGSLHDLHRDLRRLRLIVYWHHRLAPEPSRGSLEEIGRRLRRLTRLAGHVRDLDVELALWRGYRPAPPREAPRPEDALATFGRRLWDDSRTGRELLRATLLTEVRSGLLDRIRETLSQSEVPPSALRTALTGERRSLAHRAARLRRRALRTPDPDRLHKFRVLVRRLRYLSDLEDRLGGRHAPTFPPRYSGILRRLGELHDRDVLATHLNALDPAHREKRWGGRFHREHRELRRALVKELEGLHPRRHLGKRAAPSD